MQFWFDGKVENYKLVLYDEELFRQRVKELNGRSVRLTLAKGNKRTNPQNNYLWGIVYPMIGEYIGEEEVDLELIHEFCKQRFLMPKQFAITNKATGKIIDDEWLVKSTTKLSTIEFSEYIEKIQRWASKFLGIYIPDPVKTDEEKTLSMK